MGVKPQLYVSESNKVKVSCSVTGNHGVSQCHVTATEAGVYKVQSKSPPLLPVEVEFVPEKIKVLNGRGLSGVTGSTAQIQIVTSVLPVLESQPNDPTILCSAPVNGIATCSISSSVTGTKVIRVTTPSNIKEVVEVSFANEHNTAGLVPGQTAKADGTSEVAVEITLKDSSGSPLSGVVPIVDVMGSGFNTIRCDASDAQGKARCYISSTEPGDKTITIKEPLVKDTVTVNFESSPVVTAADRVPADGRSPAIIEISSGDMEGVIPELNITGPEGSEPISIVLEVKNSLGLPRLGFTPSLQASPPLPSLPQGQSPITCTAVNISGLSTCEIKEKARKYKPKKGALLFQPPPRISARRAF